MPFHDLAAPQDLRRHPAAVVPSGADADAAAASPAGRPHVVTVIQHSPDVSLDRFAEWLGGGDGSDRGGRGALGAGLTVAVVRAWAGEPVPAAPTDALIVLGGQMDAHADEVAPWLPATRALLAAAVAADVPTLGICLGAQLLAVAVGGRVQVAAPPGREAGIVDVRWRPAAAADPVLGALAAAGQSSPLPSMHADAIVDLPRGAVWLGASAVYPYQAFRIGSAWGVQFHPEASADTLRGWAQEHDDVDTGALMAAYDAREPEISAAGRAIAVGFGRVVAHARQTSAG